MRRYIPPFVAASMMAAVALYGITFYAPDRSGAIERLSGEEVVRAELRLIREYIFVSNLFLGAIFLVVCCVLWELTLRRPK